MSDGDYGEALGEQALTVVVELQRAEINRLLREHRTLNERIDRLLTLHEREQVLRQQMQAALDRITGSGQSAAASSSWDSAAGATPELAGRLARTERKFDALRSAFGQLVLLLEHQQPGNA